VTRTELAGSLPLLHEQGVVVLRGVFPKDVLTPLRRSAEACFDTIEASEANAYGFTPFSYSVILPALLEFGAGSREQLLAPVTASGFNDLLAEVLDAPAACNLEQSWVRKRFAPSNAPRMYRPNTWHQDGGLGVSYSPQPQSATPMTRLLTCWVPLRDCGRDCPGLEFIRHRLDELIHYTELHDLSLRQRFATDRFWAPELEVGDAFLFLPGSLHRTYVRPEMGQDRLSLEYRFFPVSHV
jgi:hypothetical protein